MPQTKRQKRFKVLKERQDRVEALQSSEKEEDQKLVQKLLREITNLEAKLFR